MSAAPPIIPPATPTDVQRDAARVPGRVLYSIIAAFYLRSDVSFEARQAIHLMTQTEIWSKVRNIPAHANNADSNAFSNLGVHIPQNVPQDESEIKRVFDQLTSLRPLLYVVALYYPNECAELINCLSKAL